MPKRNANNNESKELAAARAIVRGYVRDVPAAWAIAVAAGDVPAVVSDNHRWAPPPRYGRDPTTGRALEADGTPTRRGRPPGPYTRNGSAKNNERTYANSHRARKYSNSGSYSKTILRRLAETLIEHKLEERPQE
jgi:hypothetical protein